MQIRDTKYGTNRFVISIYWVNAIRHYLSTEIDKYQGVDVHYEEECELIDPSLSNFVLRKNSGGGDLLVHQAASEGDLLDELIEHDQEAMRVFLERLNNYQ
jgi:hypothetical protein